jgi:hypothetical protein
MPSTSAARRSTPRTARHFYDVYVRVKRGGSDSLDVELGGVPWHRVPGDKLDEAPANRCRRHANGVTVATILKASRSHSSIRASAQA